MAAGRILYARLDGVCVIRFVGDIRYTLSAALDAFLDKLFAEPGLQRIIVDLRAATSIDSTNLGLLAKIASFVRERFGTKPELVSTRDDVNRILESVGFSEVFEWVADCPNTAGRADELRTVEVSEEATGRTVLEAHRILCALNERNLEMFRDVVEGLESELRGTRS